MTFYYKQDWKTSVIKPDVKIVKTDMVLWFSWYEFYEFMNSMRVKNSIIFMTYELTDLIEFINSTNRKKECL